MGTVLNNKVMQFINLNAGHTSETVNNFQTGLEEIIIPQRSMHDTIQANVQR
jgi:hypothetical protein